MKPGTIEKLLELAKRGVGGEAENAKSLLQKHGIDWQSPPRESLTTKFKSLVGKEKKKYKLCLQRVGEDLLIATLLNSLGISYAIYGTEVIFECTPGEFNKVSEAYKEMRPDFLFVLPMLVKVFVGLERD